MFYRIDQRAAVWPKDETRQDLNEVGAVIAGCMNMN